MFAGKKARSCACSRNRGIVTYQFFRWLLFDFSFQNPIYRSLNFKKSTSKLYAFKRKKLFECFGIKLKR